MERMILSDTAALGYKLVTQPDPLTKADPWQSWLANNYKNATSCSGVESWQPWMPSNSKGTVEESGFGKPDQPLQNLHNTSVTCATKHVHPFSPPQLSTKMYHPIGISFH